MSYERRDITHAVDRWLASEEDSALRIRVLTWLEELDDNPGKKPSVPIPERSPAVVFFVTHIERSDIEVAVPCIVDDARRIVHIIDDLVTLAI